MFRVRVAATLAAVAVVAVPAAAPAAQQYRVTVKRTAHGIPHITAKDFASVGYGYAYAFAQDNICVLADSYVTARAERSKYFGADKTWTLGGNGATQNNLNSDFFFQRIIDERRIETLLAEPPPAGPVQEVKEGVRGFAAGYNDYLRDVGVDKIPDPTCRGKEWVTPITEMDVYRRFYQLALLASSGVAIDGIGGARPPGGSEGDSAKLAARDEALAKMDPGRFDNLLGIGSNAYGLGKQATASGAGMVLGNPHFPWDGSERFYQAHLRIPGKKVDVQGGSLFGVPLINIGNTHGLAWSHTVSTARRFTIFELKLVPGQPTRYYVDGTPRDMKATKVTVMARAADGKLTPRTRTLYATHHGPILTSILGLPVFPWTDGTAFAMGDANEANFRYLNHFFFVNQAQTVAELDAIERRYLGIPWVNTIAADSTGKAYYADIGAIPHVLNDKISACSSPAGRGTDAALRVQVLDGARSACDWGSDPDAIKPGILGPKNMPFLFRDDYVSNSNDSYWLTNPLQPLEGFGRIIGDERTARTPRTRLGLRIVQQRLDGSDRLPGKAFTLRQLQDAVFNNRQYLGELWRDELVTLCKQSPTRMGSSGVVDVSEACPVLERWDLRDDLDSRGALLFRRFASRALSSGVSSSVAPPISPYAVPFSAADPVNTPRGLNTGSPQVQQALADAVSDLRRAGIPLDAPLRDFQYEKRGDERIPIHGGPGSVGVFNAINVAWNSREGYSNVPHGSSYVQAVELKGACPDVRTILTYSQSTSSESPWFADQTRMFSRKEWVDFPFCASELARAPAVQTLVLGSARKPSRTSLLSRVRVRRLRSGRGVVVTFRLLRRANVTILAKGARTVRRRALAPRRTHRVVLRGTRGRVRVRLVAKAGKSTHAVSRTAARAR